MTGDERAARADRLARANELLQVIASCGRQFFSYRGRVARIEQDGRMRLWFRDAYTDQLVYTHYRGRWRRFTGGGTNRDLIRDLCRFVRTGTAVPSARFGPWPAWICNGDLWGYGEDMKQVRDAAERLGIIRRKPRP